MCHWILTSQTEQLIVRGTVRSAEHTERPNLVADSGELGEPEHQENSETDSHQEESTQDENNQFPLIETGDINEANLI